MNKMLYQACLFFFLFISTIASAEKQRGFPSLDLPQGKSAIYLYRQKGSGGLLVKHRFFINREFLMSIGNRGCSVAFVDPGKIDVYVESGGFGLHVWGERAFTDPFLTLNVDVEPGKSYFLKTVLSDLDTLAPTPLGLSLYLMPRADALLESKKCKYRDALKVAGDDE